MGLLTDIFDLQGENPQVLLSESDPYGKFKSLKCKGLDPVKMSTLLELCGVDTYENILKLIEPINPNDDSGMYVIPLANEVVEGIKNINMDTISEIARKWCDTDELKMDCWEYEDTKMFLMEMIVFFNGAKGPIVQIISM